MSLHPQIRLDLIAVLQLFNIIGPFFNGSKTMSITIITFKMNFQKVLCYINRVYDTPTYYISWVVCHDGITNEKLLEKLKKKKRPTDLVVV